MSATCSQKLDWMRANTHLAQRLALSLDRCLRRRAARLALRGAGRERYLDEAEWLVAEVERVLGRARGIRIGEEPDRDGQYFHYLAMWLYALAVLGRISRATGKQASSWCPDPRAFVVARPRRDLEDAGGLERPYPGYGLGALDAFDGYVSYRLLDEAALAREIAEMRELIDPHGTRSRDHAGSRDRHDAVDVAVLP